MLERSMFVIALLALALGCASGGGDKASSAAPSVLQSGAKIGQVRIVADQALASDVLEVMTQYQALERLESEVSLALAQRGAMAADGELQMLVTIDSFRLRSNAASIWLGSMAGADFIGVAVSIRRDGQELKTFSTDTSSIQGGLAVPGRTARLNRLTTELGKRVANGT